MSYDNVCLAYTKTSSLKKVKDAINESKDVIICSLSPIEFEETLVNAGYEVIEEGYELTGTNDLYQYHYSKKLS